MTMPDVRSPMTWIVAALSVVVVGGSVWAFTRGQSPSGVAVPNELTVEALKAQAKEDPAKIRDTIRDTMRRDDLTDDQRKQIGENMRKVWEDAIQERVDEYYAAQSDDDRNAVLDKQIDEFEQRRKEWQARRKEEEKKDGQDAAAQRGPGPGFMGPQSREERKERTESRNPDQAARQMAYFAAIRQRMSDRGIKPPSFGPGGRGGAGPSGGSRPPRTGP